MNSGDTIVSESPWRLVSDEGIAVSSEDHEHLFGLPKAVDAAAQVFEEIGNSEIVSAFRDRKTGDLVVKMGSGKEIQFLQLSAGYEAWCLTVCERRVICLGGGGIVSFADGE